MQGLVLRLLRERESTTSFIDTALLKRFSSARTIIIANEVATVLINFTRSYPVLFNLEETQRLYLLCMILKAFVPMMSSSHQSPFGRSRQQPRMNSPLFSTSDDNTAISNISSKSSTISGGAEGSNSCIVSTSSKTPAAKIEDKLQKDITNRALSKKAQMENDAMVYLDGPQIYTCAHCRTHLTSHDDIISKSFHGRHGMLVLVMSL